MPYDYDDNIRMDCMSPYTMKPLMALKENFDVCIANDPDSDRHGIVTKEGLLNSNHYLSSIMHYLCHNRPLWPKNGAVGKTIGATIMMDKIIEDAGYKVYELLLALSGSLRAYLNKSLFLVVKKVPEPLS